MMPLEAINEEDCLILMLTMITMFPLVESCHTALDTSVVLTNSVCFSFVSLPLPLNLLIMHDKCNPVTKSNIAKFKSVQRCATQFCCNDQQCSVTPILQELGWEDLQAR